MSQQLSLLVKVKSEGLLIRYALSWSYVDFCDGKQSVIQSYDKKDFDAVNRYVSMLYDNLSTTQSHQNSTHRHHAKKPQESQLELAFDYAVLD